MFGRRLSGGYGESNLGMGRSSPPEGWTVKEPDQRKKSSIRPLLPKSVVGTDNLEMTIAKVSKYRQANI